MTHQNGLTKKNALFEHPETKNGRVAAASSGEGKAVMEGPFNDPRYRGRGWVKMGYQPYTADGKKIAIHYMRNTNTRQIAQVKFLSRGEYKKPGLGVRARLDHDCPGNWRLLDSSVSLAQQILLKNEPQGSTDGEGPPDRRDLICSGLRALRIYLVTLQLLKCNKYCASAGNREFRFDLPAAALTGLTADSFEPGKETGPRAEE